MRRVITISLNGNAYQLEEDACGLLTQYLEDAARALAGDPDRTEIVADLEQAIADKCTRFLGPHKNVLTRAELAQVLDEMGPVAGGAEVGGAAGAAGGASGAAGDAAGGTGATPGAAGTPPGTGAAPPPAGAEPPRRLYQISEGAVISGVCNGLAAYFGVDVTLVRVVAVALAFVSAGLAVLAYLVLMFVVPYASTPEERAAAHGLPFNARVLVERAKQKYREFAHEAGEQLRTGEARREWRRSWRHARAEMRAARRHARERWRAQAAAAAPPVHYGAHVLARLLMVVFGLLLAAFVITWLFAFLSFLTTGLIFGITLPFHAPGWAVVVGLFIVFGMVTGPLRAAHHAVAGPYGPPRHDAWYGALEGIVMVIVVTALLFWAWHHSEEIRQAVHQLGDWLRSWSAPAAPPRQAT